MSHYPWYNENVQLDKNQIYLVPFYDKNNSYVSKLFRPDGSIKKWHELNTEHQLHENSYFQWLQLVCAIPEGWKFIIKETHEITTNIIIYNQHVVKASRILKLDKLSSTKIYAILISKVQNKPSSNFYFENLLNDNDIDWTAIYMLPRLATCNPYLWSFQYKFLTFCF